jgi:uncharacterized repeat protein (TIGR01451 family)
VLAFLLAVLVVSSSRAVHVDGLFELGDGTLAPGSADILGSDVQPGCDWGDLFDADPTDDEIADAVEACGGIAALFVADDLARAGSKDDTVFTNGSAKNNDPVVLWNWDSSSVPAKDDLANVYAFATLDAAGDLILFAGLERIKASGDSHVDFEFNQDPIQTDGPPPCGDDGSDGAADGSPCEFVGSKTVNDLLVVMDFQQGGDLGVLEIRRWDGSEYVLVETIGGEGCNAADTACAFNNGVEIPGGAWDNFDDRGRVVDTLQPNAFTEVGINISAMLGQTPCFVSVLAKSRSSSSFNSSLKDFASGEAFGICSVEVTKQGAGANPGLALAGEDFEFLFTVENTGGAELFLVEMVDDDLGNITEEASAGGCDSLAPGGFCSFSIVSAVPEDEDDPFVSNVSVTFSDASGATVGDVSDSDDFSLNLFQPAVSVVKSGDTLSTVGNVVGYSITVTNDGSDDSPALVDGSIVDSLLGDLLDPLNPFVDGAASTCTPILATGDGCSIVAQRTVQPGDPDPLPNTVTVSYVPEGFVTEVGASDDHAVDLVAGAMSITITVSPESGAVGDLVTYTFVLENTGDVALERISVIDTLLGDLSALFPEALEAAESVVQVVVQREIQAGDPNPLTGEVTVTYQVQGLPNQIIESATSSVEIVVPCALSPGFWKGGEGVPKWDDLATDPVAQAAGFDGGTPFPYVAAPLADATYLDVLNLPVLGDITRQLGFKYIAARLNQAAFGVPGETAELLDAIDAYFAGAPVGSRPDGAVEDEGQALGAALNAYFLLVGEEDCPDTSSF